MRAVQAAAVDRALTCGDPALARRHLRLVAALEGADGTVGPLAVAALAASAPAPPHGPEPPTPGSRSDDAAVRGAAVAVARFDRSPGRIAAAADLPCAAVRRALAPI